VKIERLPYHSQPGFDCRNDHANCPACAAHGEADHGIHGGEAWFAVRTQIADGRHVVLVLDVFLANYLTCSPRVPIHLRKARGKCIEQHIESDAVDCMWMPSGRCDDGPAHGHLSYLVGDQLYREYGNDSGDDHQSEEFWGALEKLLEHWAGQIPVMS
jgi:hypothetical protein